MQREAAHNTHGYQHDRFPTHRPPNPIGDTQQ